MTTCDGTVATTTIYTDDACTIVKENDDEGNALTPTTLTYVNTCAAGAGDAFEFSSAVVVPPPEAPTPEPPAVEDCPTLVPELFELVADAADDAKCTVAMGDGETKTALTDALTFDTTGACIQTVEAADAVEKVDPVADDPATEDVDETVVGVAAKPAVDAEYTKTVCNADKKAVVTVYTDAECTTAKVDAEGSELKTEYSYASLDTCTDGTDFSYKLAEPAASEGDSERASALMATTVAALALIASQF